MKLTLTALTVAATMFASNASAADPDDLQKLKDTRSCWKCDLSDGFLESTKLRGAMLNDADLNDANLRGAILINADLKGANMESTNLWGANLTGADLNYANMKDAI